MQVTVLLQHIQDSITGQGAVLGGHIIVGQLLSFPARGGGEFAPERLSNYPLTFRMAECLVTQPVRQPLEIIIIQLIHVCQAGDGGTRNR